MARPTIACARCGGHPDRYDDGCARCDDSGVEPLEREAPIARPRVHAYATERADARMRSGLVHMRRADATYLAQSLARALAFEAAPALELVIGRSGWAGAPLSESDARKVIGVYVDAIREQAIAWRSRVGRGDHERDARDAEAHARRVEECLPAWLRAAAS